MKNEETKKYPLLLCRWELWVVLALLAAGLLWWGIARGQGPGAVALVSVATADEGESLTEIPLRESGTYPIQGELPVTLEVKGGAIRFVDSVCPDHVCEDFGWLRREGEWALCAPAGVLVRVVEDADA